MKGEFGRGMKEFGMGLSVIVNSVLLIVVYLIGVGFTSIIAKIFGKKFFPSKNPKSYWQDLNLTKLDMNEYYKQF